MAINSRNKGAKTERQVAKVLQDWTGKEFSRTPSSGGLKWHNRSSISGDIVCTTEGHYFPFSVEVKNHKESKINFEHPLYLPDSRLQKFWQQATGDAKKSNKQPLLMVRYNHMPKDTYFLFITPQLLSLIPKKTQKQISHIKLNILGDNPMQCIGFNSIEFFNLINYRTLKKAIKNHGKA